MLILMKPCKAWRTERCRASLDGRICEHSSIHEQNYLCNRGSEDILCPVCETYLKDLFEEDEFNVS